MSSCGVGDDAQQADRLGQLETFARTAQQQWDVSGMAIAIVKNDEVIYAKGFGVKRVGGTEPVDADTVFEIGSTSKAFTAAVVALQVDDGKVGWSDRVIDHLPAFEMRDPWVTREFQVADLMAQHSGMPAYAGDGMAFLGFPADYIVAHMKHLDPVTSFRSEFAYVNNLFLVAGDLARATSGKTWGGERPAARVRSPRHAVELVSHAATSSNMIDEPLWGDGEVRLGQASARSERGLAPVERGFPHTRCERCPPASLRDEIAGYHGRSR